MGFLMGSESSSPPPLPAAPPAAAPATLANTGIAMTAANQRKKAQSAAGATSANPDLSAAPTTAKSNLLGP